MQVAVKQLRRFWHWINPPYCRARADPKHASCPVGPYQGHAVMSPISPAQARQTAGTPSGAPATPSRRPIIRPSLTVAAVAELIGKRRMGRRPAEFGPGLSCVGALIE